MATTRIAILDHDHVLRLIEVALMGIDPEGADYIRNLFAPAPIDLAEVDAAAAGLRRRDGVEVLLPGQDPKDADIVIMRRGVVDRAFLEASPRLKLVQRYGQRSAGIDLSAAQQRGVHVAGVVRPSLKLTAEHAVLLMLALGKRLLPADQAVREGSYDLSNIYVDNNVALRWAGSSEAHGLFGRTLGLIGFGEVAAFVNTLAQAFGMRVLYANRSRYPEEFEQAAGIAFRPLPDLLREADVVSLHASNLPGNESLIGRAEFARMQPHALFVNTSRGRLVDEDALYDALVQRRIAGAGLDVHRVEPRPSRDRFAGLDNVILTPHIAGGARPTYIPEITALFDNCRAVLAGRPPVHCLLA